MTAATSGDHLAAYPNERDYTRTTRLESVLLGFVRSRADLQAPKRGLLRSNTRGVYRDDDDRWAAGHPEVQRLAEAIEHLREEVVLLRWPGGGAV